MNETQQNESIGFLRFEKPALVLGVLGLAACGAGFATAQQQFVRSWLLGFVFWISLTVGSLALVMLQYMTGGWWGYLIRRPLLAAIRNLPLMVVAALPLYLGLDRIYPWTNAELMATDHVLHQKVLYLNPQAFMIRGAVFFAIWILWAFMIRRHDAAFEASGSQSVARSLRKWSASGLLILAITLTFAAVDWMMSLDPYWYSTMFGLSYLVGVGLLAFAFMIAVMASIADHPAVSEVTEPIYFRDLGNLMFAFTMLWAYTGFSQFLLVWYANLKEEIPWYMMREHGGWGVVSVILLVGHFFLPFLLLLQRGIKDRPRFLGKVAVYLVVMRAVDYFWIIAPNWTAKGHESTFQLHWLDFASLIGIGGIWVFFFLRTLKSGALVPAQESVEGRKEALSHG